MLRERHPQTLTNMFHFPCSATSRRGVTSFFLLLLFSRNNAHSQENEYISVHMFIYIFTAILGKFD